MNELYIKRYFFRAKLAALFLRLTPYVRMVILNGSLSSGKARAESDIDFLVILKKKRIWSGRFFTTAIIQLMGLRRTPEKIAGKICLNYYLTEDYLKVLELEKNASCYSSIIVLLGNRRIFEKYCQANAWFKKFKQAVRTQDLNKIFWQNVIFFPLQICQFLLEFIFELVFSDWGERQLKVYQIKKIAANPLTKLAKKNEIYLSDRELRFHPSKTNVKLS